MQRFRVTCKGISPLLINRMGEDELLGLRDKTRKKSKSAPKLSLQEEAEQCLHLDGDKRPCIPDYMLLATLMNAGVFIRLDQKRQLSTKDSSLLPGLLFLEDNSYPLLMPGDGSPAKWGLASWRYDVRQGRNPNGGEAVCLVRPMFEQWAIHFTVVLDTDELAEDTFLRLFSLAGKRVGLGDFRPQRKGRCGMFALTLWEGLEKDVDFFDAPVIKKAAA